VISRTAKVLGFFFRDKKKVERYVVLYIHHRNLYNKGANEVAFFKSFANTQMYILWWLFARNVWPDLPVWLFLTVVPVVVLVKIFFNWLVGYWWDRNDLYDRESDWSNKRNPVMNGIEKQLLDK
jgi:hypothetical protein